ncbi:MAG TPA: SRPBCC family protein [Polyangiaceae bacterium]
MNVEGIEVGAESNERTLEPASDGGAKRHDRTTRGWVGVGVGVGAAVALAVLRGRSQGSRARALTWAGAAVTGATLVDTLVLVRRRGLLRAKPRPVSLHSTVTIRRSRDDIYRYWRELKNLAVFMRHIDSVSETNGHSLWRAWGPAGVHAEWEAEIVADRPGERIAWRSLEGATVPNRGSVEFRDAPGGQGTEVHLEIVFEPPAGSAGAGIARLFATLPEQSMKSDLRRLKQLLETGEIVCSDASIHRGTHPARPPERSELPLVNGMVRS